MGGRSALKPWTWNGTQLQKARGNAAPDAGDLEKEEKVKKQQTRTAERVTQFLSGVAVVLLLFLVFSQEGRVFPHEPSVNEGIRMRMRVLLPWKAASPEHSPVWGAGGALAEGRPPVTINQLGSHPTAATRSALHTFSPTRPGFGGPPLQQAAHRGPPSLQAGIQGPPAQQTGRKGPPSQQQARPRSSPQPGQALSGAGEGAREARPIEAQQRISTGSRDVQRSAPLGVKRASAATKPGKPLVRADNRKAGGTGAGIWERMRGTPETVRAEPIYQSAQGGRPREMGPRDGQPEALEVSSAALPVAGSDAHLPQLLDGFFGLVAPRERRLRV